MMPWPPRGNEPIDWHDDPVEPPPPPSAGRSIRLGFSAVYEYIGSALVASLAAFVLFYSALALLANGVLHLGAVSPGRGVLLILWVLLAAPLILGPFTAGLFALARAMFRRDDPHVLDVWRVALRLARPAWALAYLQTLVTTVLVSDVIFLLSRSGVMLKVVGVVVAYALLFWLMMATYHWALLVERETKLGVTLRNAMVLSLANPFYTLIITLLVSVLLLAPILGVALTLVGYRTAAAVLVPVALVWGVLLPALQTSATLEILRKYETPPDEQPE
jgi:uncharacterized membrane protein YesL